MKHAFLIALSASLFAACASTDGYSEGVAADDWEDSWEDESWRDDPRAAGLLGEYRLETAPRRLGGGHALMDARFSVVFEEDVIRGVTEHCGEFERGYFLMDDMICPLDEERTAQVTTCEQSPEEWAEVSQWLMSYFGRMNNEPTFEVNGDRLIVKKGRENKAVFIRVDKPSVGGASGGGAGGASTR